MTATLRVALPLDADHPALTGHFPGHPIYPGVVLLDAAIAAIEAHYGARVEGLPVAKFHAPLAPGMALALTAERGERDVRFELTSGGVRVATGTVRLQSAEPDRAQA
jgi:3-hydroxymyristoyl/3-hydroxydecanoyl-(acyl carrier protein) dehydratase